MTHITRFSFIFDVFYLCSMYKLINNIEKSIVGLFTRKPLDIMASWTGSNYRLKRTVEQITLGPVISGETCDRKFCLALDFVSFGTTSLTDLWWLGFVLCVFSA